MHRRVQLAAAYARLVCGMRRSAQRTPCIVPRLPHAANNGRMHVERLGVGLHAARDLFVCSKV